MKINAKFADKKAKVASQHNMCIIYLCNCMNSFLDGHQENLVYSFASVRQMLNVLDSVNYVSDETIIMWCRRIYHGDRS